MSAPEFVDRIGYFSVTFPNHTLLGDEVVAWINSLGEHGLSDSQCVALALLREGKLLDNQAYRSATGLDSQVARAELRDLVARELVVQNGGRRWTRYALAPGLAAAPGGATAPNRRRADRRDQLLDILGDEELSRAELVERSGLSNPTVTRWLRVLRREGLVEVTEEAVRSPHLRYRRSRQVALDEGR